MSPPTPAQLAPLREPTPKWWPLLVAVLVLTSLLPVVLILAPPVLGLPRYEVSGGQVVARSLASKVVIPAGTPAEKVSLGRLSKQVGSNMPGYTVGHFRSERGELAVYGNGSRTGLLFGTQPPTFLTPADPETLLIVWKKGDAATFRPRGVPLRENIWPLLLLLPLSLAVGSLLISRPRLSYEIHGDTLTVKTRASSTDFLRQSTKASVTSDPLGVRLFGTGMPGYHTGTFSTRLGNVQAAASSARPEQALLLEHAGKRYYLTPSDPAAVEAWFGG
ncbi:PH domain-containing protein [Deinococcus radiodurans]|jgi:hypothetical protein|uniref:PH domain-containing protein n=1 Tax=Deinococcus radiodurans TaxID=1299 RepID=UPI00138E2C29|nr:PH domain-containing protein [Deinococcus radiodurans]QIP27794.1 hypothetical protein HAV23_00055 [Deinococcus radiodurans]QIP31324.1 hypothetical protein HAV35_03460 [Deinococcus radiodurans]UID71048.1 hypothetical protein DRO_2055 [Deinococcus radiodurans R1 = ATCC 13939 = DSM 20539]